MSYFARNATAMDGSTNILSITFPFMASADIHVYIDTVEVTGWTLLNPGQLQLPLSAGSYAGKASLVQRITPMISPAVVFQSGQVSAAQLNLQKTQLLYGVQEALDDAEFIAELIPDVITDIQDAGAAVLQAITDANTAVQLDIVNARADALQAVIDQQVLSIQAVVDQETLSKAAVVTQQVASIAAVGVKEALSIANVAAQETTSKANVVTQENSSVTNVLNAAGTKVYASVADALSKGLVTSVLNAAGSGASVTGQYPVLATNGGGTQGLLLVNVAGGVITSVIRVSNPGRGYTSVPTTWDTSAITGLTGATFTTTIGQNRNVGEYFAIQSLLNGLYDFYVVATVSTATYLGTAPSLAQVLELQNSGGMQNMSPDPFFNEMTIAGGLVKNGHTLTTFIPGSPALTIGTDALSPYPGGKVLMRPNNNTTTSQTLYLDELGATEGSVIEVIMEARRTVVGSSTSLVFATGQLIQRNGVSVGASFPIVGPTAGNPLNDTAFRSFTSGKMTLIAGQAALRITYNYPVGTGVNYCSQRMLVGSAVAASKPVERLVLPYLNNRVIDLEEGNPQSAANGVLLRRTTWASVVSAALVGTMGARLTTFAASYGFAQSYLAAAFPASGFNIISTPLVWTPNADTGPVRFYVTVRTSLNTIDPNNGGKTLAVGWIDVDPMAGSAGSEAFQLFDPIDRKTPKTVALAEILDVFGITLVGVNKAGGASNAMGLNVTYGTFANADTNALVYRLGVAAAGLGSGWNTPTGSGVWLPDLLLATSPVTAVRTPSDTFAAAIGASLDEAPAFLAPTRKIWGVVGRESSVYLDTLMQRNYRNTNWRVSAGTFPANSGMQEERLKMIPAAAGTINVTLEAYRGNTFSGSCAIQYVSVAASAAAGTKNVHCMGDSMIANGGLIAAAKVIEAGQAVTQLNFTGTQGSAGLKHDGYSGKALAAFIANVTLDGTNPNPFIDTGTGLFSYAWYRTHAGSGDPAPDMVVLEAGGVDVGAFTSDAAANTAAAGWATVAEVMVASITAAGFKVAIQTIAPGPFPETDYAAVYGGATFRQRRNWRILNAKAHSQFGGREGSGIYVIPAGSSVDPATGWPKVLLPRHAAVVRDATNFTTKVLMEADVTKAAGSIATCTDTGGTTGGNYFVKIGPTGTGGRWREAEERDGFVMRLSVDGIHTGLGEVQKAEALWALLKNVT